MVRVGGLVIIIGMTTVTRVRRGRVVSVMTQVTIIGNGYVRPLEYPVAVVNREGSRLPAGVGRMTRFARCG